MADCGCGCGPWITLSACKPALFDADGALAEVRCPSMLCLTMVPLVAGRIGYHESTLPGYCAFIGTRVVDDSADFGRGPSADNDGPKPRADRTAQ